MAPKGAAQNPEPNSGATQASRPRPAASTCSSRRPSGRSAQKRDVSVPQSPKAPKSIAGALCALCACQVGFAKMRGLSIQGNCKTFDTSADGFARGEGMGASLGRSEQSCHVLPMSQWLDGTEAPSTWRVPTPRLFPAPNAQGSRRSRSLFQAAALLGGVARAFCEPMRLVNWTAAFLRPRTTTVVQRPSRHPMARPSSTWDALLGGGDVGVFFWCHPGE